MNSNFRLFYWSLCLLLATPFLVFGGVEFPYQTSRIILSSLAFIGIFVATLRHAHSDPQFKTKFISVLQHPVILVYGLLIGWLFVRSLPVFLAETWWGTWFRFDGILFELAFVLSIASCAAWISFAEFSREQKKLLLVLGVVLIGSLVLFPLLGLDKFVGQLPNGRFQGSVGNPLYLAGLLLFIPWFASLYRNTFVTWTSFVLAALFVYATDTRGAFIALGAGICVFVWEYKKIPLKFRSLVGVLVILGGIALGLALLKGSINIARYTTIATRLAMWKSGVHEFIQQPLIGYGVGAHRDAIDRSSALLSAASYGEITDSTHSAYLDLALKGGLIALLIYVVWSIAVYRALRADDSNDQAMARATFAAYSVLLATAPWMSWTAIPLIFLLATHIKSGSTKEVPSIFAYYRGVVILTILSLLFVVIFTVQNARYLYRISGGFVRQDFIGFSEGNLSTNKFTPFAKDFMVEFLRLTLPRDVFAVAPSLQGFLINKAVPVVNGLEAMQLHPDAYNVVATWENLYASQGFSLDKKLWLERSLALQYKALEINPDRPATIFQAAETLHELGKTDEALKILREFSERAPYLVQAHLRLAMMLDISGDARSAFALVQKIKKDFPDFGWTADYEGWVQGLEKRAQGAASK